MKKLVLTLAVALALTACNTTKLKAVTTDSTKVDTIVVVDTLTVADTLAVDTTMADTTK